MTFWGVVLGSILTVMVGTAAVLALWTDLKAKLLNPAFREAAGVTAKFVAVIAFYVALGWGAYLLFTWERPAPTAICRDGTPSYSKHRQGTCSWHGGVANWR